MKITTLFLLITFSFFPLSIFSQKTDIDSIMLSIKKIEGNEKVDRFNDLMSELICQNDSLATIIFQNIQDILKNDSYPKGRMEAYRHYGTMMYCQGKLDSIIFYQKKSAQIGEENDFHSFSGRMYSNLGFLFSSSGDVDSSSFYFNKALSLAIQAGDSLGISVTYTGLGINAREQGYFDQSLEMYLKALSISENQRDTLGILTAKMNLLNFYRDHRPDLFTEKEVLIALKMAEQVEELQHQVSAYEYLGYLKSDSGEFEQAFEYLRRGLELNKNLKDYNRQISLLGAMSYAHGKSGEFKLAIRYNNEAIGNAISSDFIEYLPSLYASNVEHYIELADYTNAIAAGKKTLKYGKDAESIDLYYKTLQKMAFAYYQLGKNEEAYQAQLEYSQLSEELLNSKKTEQLADMQTKYETEKKEAEIASLSQKSSIQALEIRQKNQALVIGVVVFLFVLAVIFFLYKQRETKKQQSQTELEQRFLRSQLNPHFISNALVAVQSFMLKNDSESAALYLTKFSKLMREILENSRKEFIPVEEEISMLRNYLDIHKLRLGTFDFSIEIDENIDPETDTIPPMFVQPFVENAIEHGISNEKAGKIELKFRKEGEYISIEVNDNGLGISSNKKVGHNSLSSTIIQERMELFNKSLKRKIRLVMNNLENERGEIGGARVQLKVPFSNV